MVMRYALDSRVFRIKISYTFLAWNYDAFQFRGTLHPSRSKGLADCHASA